MSAVTFRWAYDFDNSGCAHAHRSPSAAWACGRRAAVSIDWPGNAGYPFIVVSSDGEVLDDNAIRRWVDARAERFWTTA